MAGPGIRTHPTQGETWRPRALGYVLAWGTLVVVLSVYASGLALGWDEGYTFDRIEALENWLGSIGAGGRSWSAAFTREALDRGWRFSKEEPDGHGPYYALLSFAGHALSGRWLGPPLSYRIGSIALFALAVVAVYATLRREWGRGAALFASVLLAAMPRLVPEACYALIDGPLASLALLAWCAFVKSTRSQSNASAAAFGFFLGCAMANKLTGWLLPAPYLAWSALEWQRTKNRRPMVVFAAGAAVALLTALVLNVGWWPNPIAGATRFFRSNLTREETIPIATLFAGEKYPFALPWYNTIVWTAIAVPAGTLVFGLVGVIAAIRSAKRDSFGLLMLLNWLLIMVVRALPQAPGHDGTRQLVIALALFALLAGLGFQTLVEWADRINAAWKKRVVAALGILAVAESVGSCIAYYPMPLSYYSPIVGGLPGATRLGFEPTYFWDSVTPDVLDWINENTPPGEWVMFRNNPRSWEYLRRWGRLKPPYIPPGSNRPPTWVIYQHRPGILLEADEWLIEHEEPAFRKRLWGVPVLSIYRGEQFMRSSEMAHERNKNKPQ